MNIDELILDLHGSYATLDLHGLYPEDAEIEIDHFLTVHHSKAETVKIVYGVGSGILKKASLDFLEYHPMVKKIIEGQGFCLVFFYHKR